MSTQANTLNVDACAVWQDLGVERVILAREVPVREIAEIHEALPDLELETFVHGSLCVAYSGRCLISDYLTDNTKNSNKGMCGNSCRWEFEQAGNNGAAQASDSAPGNGCSHHNESFSDETDDAMPSLEMQEVGRPNEAYTFEEDERGTYMLNSRDLCLVGYLKELQSAGVVSFKIEGRTKSVYYAANSTRIYRQAIDWFQQHDEASETQINNWVRELSLAGNRGFTEGFIHGRPNHLAYNYQNSDSQQGATFLATAKTDTKSTSHGLDANGHLLVQARNPFKCGDTIDWVTPTGHHTFTLNQLLDKHGLPVDVVQTNHEVAIPCPSELVNHTDLAWSVLRRREALLTKTG